MNGKINSYNSTLLMIESIHSLREFMHGNSKFKYCWDVFKLIFILSHGQASVVKRGFSIKKDLLKENVEEVSIVSQTIVFDHICDLSVTDIPFSNDFLKSCKLSHTRSTNGLELKKSDKIENEKIQERRIKMDDIVDVKREDAYCWVMHYKYGKWHWEIPFGGWKRKKYIFAIKSKLLS